VIQERVRQGESFEETYRRFKRECEKEQLFAQIKRREFYEKPSKRKKNPKPKKKK
jgi:small subunit ribosomal protein S21